MRRIARRGFRAAVVVIAVAAAGTAASGTAYVMSTSRPRTRPVAPPSRRPTAPVVAAPVVPAHERPAALKRMIPPDFLVVASRPIDPKQLGRVGRLAHVRDVVTVDAGAVRLRDGRVNMFAVDPVRFRSWTPPGTATDDALWSALGRDRFVVSDDVRRRLGLRAGTQYPITGRTRLTVAFGGAGPLGLPGINVLVGRDTGRRIGLLPNIGLLVNAPGADRAALRSGLREAVGAESQIIDLDDKENQPEPASHGRPGTYLELYQRSAAVCPGLSWTVLAAVGQIESGHGRDVGPSSAGALGPMQFMPATWRAYGVDGDGDGRADIMDPYDAVPTAARYLCANGAGRGGDSLANAVWHYNHSRSYVDAVLSLARAYARRFS